MGVRIEDGGDGAGENARGSEGDERVTDDDCESGTEWKVRSARIMRG